MYHVYVQWIFHDFPLDNCSTCNIWQPIHDHIGGHQPSQAYFSGLDIDPNEAFGTKNRQSLMWIWYIYLVEICWTCLQLLTMCPSIFVEYVNFAIAISMMFVLLICLVIVVLYKKVPLCGSRLLHVNGSGCHHLHADGRDTQNKFTGARWFVGFGCFKAHQK